MSYADSYASGSQPQQTAAQRLIDMLPLRGNPSILDIGCGLGDHAFHLATLTDGPVVGIDVCPKMIANATKKYSKANLHFESAGLLGYQSTMPFDYLFANSSLHWITNNQAALRCIYSLLKTNGVLAVQIPFTSTWCDAVNYLFDPNHASPSLANLLQHFVSPWFFYPSEKAIHDAFHTAGLRINQLEVSSQKQPFSSEALIRFISAAPMSAYLNTDNYTLRLPSDFKATLDNHIMKTSTSFMKQHAGNVLFKRVYILAEKI